MGATPCTLNLKEFLQHFLDFRWASACLLRGRPGGQAGDGGGSGCGHPGLGMCLRRAMPGGPCLCGGVGLHGMPEAPQPAPAVLEPGKRASVSLKESFAPAPAPRPAARVGVVERRSRHELGRAQKRLHLVEGLLLALADLDAVVATIRQAADAAAASEQLQARGRGGVGGRGGEGRAGSGGPGAARR